MGASGADWAPEAAALAEHGEVIAPDRPGYGSRPAPEGYVGTTVLEQSEDLAWTIAEEADGPVLLAGRDFGALVGLDVLLRRPELVAGAVLVAPPLYSLVAEATDVLTAERIALGEKLHDAGPRAAMEAWLGRTTDADPAAFFADYAGITTLPVTRRELRGIVRPVLVLTGPRPEAHVRAAAAALVKALPQGRLEDGADVVAAVLGVLDEVRTSS